MNKIFIILVIISASFVTKATELELKGNWRYSIDYSKSTVHITGDKIINNSESKSGTIKIRLFLTRTKYTGVSITGYVLAEYQFDPLPGQNYYYDIDKNLNFSNTPPAGTYYVTLTLLEYTNDGYVIMNYLNYDNQITFENSSGNANNYYIPYNPYAIPNNSLGGYTNQKRTLCYECHGLGSCIVCHGTGTYSAYGYSHTCSACGGTGICSRCKGTKYEN
jgi:hypothetical protein